MHQLVVCVLPDVEVCPNVLKAWDAVGVSGVTILESTGLGQIREAIGLQELPLLPRLSDFMRGRETRNRTLMTVVHDDEMVDRLIAATESVVGPLDAPHSGILFVLPVSRVVGLPRRNAD